jgi:iron-sulfur cluster insertion protein
VKVTDKAAEQLKTLLDKEQKNDSLIRIYFAGYSCSGPQYAPALDMEKKEEDVVTNMNGINVVYDKNLENDLKDFELDYIKTPYGEGFIVRNPNATCGSDCSGCH